MIVSVNLNSIPFLSSTDSTRATMSTKQIQQTLTSLNTEIPFVIGEDYKVITETSKIGMLLAQEDGEVLYKNDDLLIVQYITSDKIQDIHLPPIKKTTSSFGTKLRFTLHEGAKFKKGDILANYDCFLNGVPSYGYNVFTAFMPWFGYNHEDAITLSESLAKKATYNQIDKVYIPIYEYTLMQELYNKSNSHIYIPGIGQQLEDNVICSLIAPKDSSSASDSDLKYKVQTALKNMTLSDLLNAGFAGNNKFMIDKIKTKIEKGIVSGLKIHRFKTKSMIDQKLEGILDNLYLQYGMFITNIYNDLQKKFNYNYIIYILKKYYLYADKTKGIRGDLNLNNLCYLIELEISKESPTKLGDKIANRYANKGVISLILPDELRPIAVNTNKPLDLIFNPFGVFSRQNLGQLLEAIVGKSTMICNDRIRNNPDNIKETITWLNDSVLQYINKKYYSQVQEHIINNLDNEEFKAQFIKDINQSNLFVEAPSFAKIDIKKLLKHSINYKEPVLIKKETIKFMKQKLKLEHQLPDTDVYLQNILCAPIYIQKLSKLVEKIFNARDFGSVKTITHQPTKGRSKGGGSRVGQMEIESILAHGCDLAVKEMLSVKSDWTMGKKDLIRQLILDGKYNIPENRQIKSRTKEVVDIQLAFLKE